MKRPRITDAVRRGLLMATVLADSWREADGDESLDPQDVEDLDAANDYVKRGGLRQDRPQKEEAR